MAIKTVCLYVHASVVCVALYVELSYGDLRCIAAVKFLSPVPYVIVAVFVLVSYLLTFVLLCTKGPFIATQLNSTRRRVELS